MDWLLVEVPVLDVPVILAVGLVGLWLLLRSRSTFESGSELDAAIGGGKPVVLNFFGKL